MEMSTSESFIEPPTSPFSPDEIDSLPSSSTSSSADDDEYLSDADREWKESLQQLELLLTMVMVPYLGKYFGRKAAYWGTSYSRYGRYIVIRALTEMQGGPSSWSGSTLSKSSSPIRRRSKQPVLLRRQRHYDLVYLTGRSILSSIGVMAYFIPWGMVLVPRWHLYISASRYHISNTSIGDGSSSKNSQYSLFLDKAGHVHKSWWTPCSALIWC
jgi:hypothetical protein